MILYRIGNKTKWAVNIEKYFPPHDLYVELFFGGGGMFFNKTSVPKYNILNDLDDDIFNLFNIISDPVQLKELIEMMELTPVSQTLFNHWKNTPEILPLKKAARFLFLSNFSLYGQNTTFRIRVGNTRSLLIQELKQFWKGERGDCLFMSEDFRNVLKKISIKEGTPDPFIYADPPYLHLSNNYNTLKWSLQDTTDLFELLATQQYPFAISEFSNPIILQLAEQWKLNVIYLMERRSIKNRNTEILITNYKPQNTLFL